MLFPVSNDVSKLDSKQLCLYARVDIAVWQSSHVINYYLIKMHM